MSATSLIRLLTLAALWGASFSFYAHRCEPTRASGAY